MKKLITLAVIAFYAATMNAEKYTDLLTVNMNGTEIAQQASIDVNENAGKYTLSLKNFVIKMGTETMGVGNIVLNNIEPQTMNNGVVLHTKQNVTITAGDDPAVLMWIGPNLGETPVELTAKISDGKLRALIEINTESVGKIDVTFGSNFQIKNSDFELFHVAVLNEDKGDEPNNWHSFATATGSYASMMSGKKLVSKSEETRPGSTGKASAKLMSTKIIFVVSNGTMTTGRLSANDMTPEGKGNNSSLDISKTDLDGNNDPFYSLLGAKPDSIATWIKFKQGTPNADYPYACISAVVTDGTYYQDPEDKTYTNVVAKAANTKIESKNGVWQKIVVPFDYNTYINNKANTKAILVTISTNATPGKGSGTDELFIDDMQLVYNNKLSSIKINNQELNGFDANKTEYNVTLKNDISLENVIATPNAVDAIVVKQIEKKSSEDCVITVKVLSGELKNATTYTINAKIVTAINNLDADNNEESKYYNVAGQQVQQNNKKQVVIKKNANKKAIKVIK